jgi:hypothetical protein
MFEKIPDISKAHRIVGSMPIAILANSIFFFFKKVAIIMDKIMTRYKQIETG